MQTHDLRRSSLAAALALVAILALPRSVDAQGAEPPTAEGRTADTQSGDWPPGKVEKNVVYGMFSGLALLMDVYYPEDPNGIGLLVIPGSGFSEKGFFGKADVAAVDGGRRLAWLLFALLLGSVGGARCMLGSVPGGRCHL